jgi:hypothetical protein
MKVSQAIQSFREHHWMNSKKNTLKNYEFIFTRFQDAFGARQIESITTDQRYLGKVTDVGAIEG